MLWTTLVLVSLCGLVQGLSRVDPLVSTKAGLIRGLQSNKGYAKFLGVPYGMVDKNNPFGPAFPHPGFDNIFEAYEANACPQVYGDLAVGTLDCLSLNIYVPNTASSANRLPVMVWIHGGAYVEGSADIYSVENAEPTPLLRHDVIVVGINYRLGAYGFMCLDIPEVPGNQGLKDQVLALRWIQDNIEAFGGNARSITVFGESAGGMSVNLHLLSHYESLFQKAIIQSGPAISPWAMEKSNNSIPLRLAAALNYNTEDVLEALTYLSSVDAHTIVKLAHDMKITSSVGTDQPLTKPCVEKSFEGVESFITDHPLNIKSTKVANTPVIIGNNDNELAFQYETANAEFFSDYSFNDILSMSFKKVDDLVDAVDDIRHFYIGDEMMSENEKIEITDFASDFIFNHPTQVTTQLFLENGAINVYHYIFSYNGVRNMMNMLVNLNATGAVHSDEIGYLFDFGSLTAETSPEDQLVVDSLTTLWTNFAKNPVPTTSELLPVIWQPVTKTTQPYLEINSRPELKARPFHERMAFWDLFYKVYGKVPEDKKNRRKNFE